MKKLIIHPLLLAIFPVLFLWNKNSDLISVNFIYLPLLVSAAVITVLYLITNYIVKNKIKSAIILSVLILLFSTYGHYIMQIYPFIVTEGINTYVVQWFTLFFWILIFLVIAFLVWGSKKDFTGLNYFLNSISIILIIFSIISISNNYFFNSAGHQSNTGKIQSNERADNKLPDIYYIILDGYARADILKKMYSLDNSSFINALENKGFYIASSSYANYPQTFLSMASSLNMDYIQALIDNNKIETSDRKQLKTLIKNHELYKFLKGKGYTFVGLPYTWSGLNKNQNTNLEIKNNLSVNDFNQLLINTTPLGILGLNNYFYNTQRKKILFNFNSLPDIANMPEPTFVYSHILSPHPPFLFDKNGNPKNPDVFTTGEDGKDYLKFNPGKDKYIKEYTEQTQYINSLVLLAIDGILNNSKTRPIIILQSDHGPGLETDFDYPQKTNMEERMAILNAYYLPPESQNKLYKNISPVNSFRLIQNEIFNTSFNLLEDRSFFSTWNKPYEFMELSQQLIK